MKLTTARLHFLDALVEHGPISFAPPGVRFPSDVSLALMERAGWITSSAVGPATHHVAHGNVTRRLQFAITPRGLAERANGEALRAPLDAAAT